MGLIASSTGHSKPEEKKVAKLLYISITFAVVFAAVVFFWVGNKTSMKPSGLDKASMSHSE